MPRLQPAPGYITAKQATEILDISDATLSSYVKSGRLRRYGPPDRKYKFYKLSEVEAVKAARNIFEPVYVKGDLYNNPSTKFEAARLEDISSIVNIDKQIFDEEDPVDENWYKSWWHKNPETFFVLHDPGNTIKSYVCLLPIERHALDRFIHDEIGMETLSDHVDTWEVGKPLHVYVIAMGVDPQCKIFEKREYGARMIFGVSSLLLDLAGRGVEIETITARSYKKDGITLMRKIGMTHLRSPVPNKNLFVVKVAESGFPILEKYSSILEQWKKDHQKEN